MPKYFIAAAAFVLGFAAWDCIGQDGHANAEGGGAAASEFQPLFNGKDLEGWEIRGEDDGFRVKDGVIRSETGWGGQLMYYTQRTFKNFLLHVEWRVAEGGNSGVFIRAPKEGWPWETAWEIQISDEEPPRDDSHCTGSLYGYAAVDPRPETEPGEWHSFDIVCHGGRIQVSVDQQQVIDYQQNSKPETEEKPLEGYIGLQDSHGPEGTWVEYRNIQVMPLD